MKTDGLDDAFNVETNIVPAEIEKIQKKVFVEFMSAELIFSN